MKRIFFLLLVTPALYAQPEIGVVQRMENDSLLQRSGFRHLVESTARLFSPENVSDQQFDVLLEKIDSLATPLLATNIFIPAHLKVVGPSVDEAALLNYVEAVFRRAGAAGVGMIVWGSGGSRSVPEGFDRETARAQFIAAAKKIAACAEKYNIILALENLNRTEVNFINTLGEAHDIARAVDHPNLRLCADIYHMLKEGEPPGAIAGAGKYVVYAELAEKEHRAAPGTAGEDFRPYFQALKNIGFTGKVVIECRWDDIAVQAPVAFQEVQRQLKDVFSGR